MAYRTLEQAKRYFKMMHQHLRSPQEKCVMLRDGFYNAQGFGHRDETGVTFKTFNDNVGITVLAVLVNRATPLTIRQRTIMVSLARNFRLKGELGL